MTTEDALRRIVDDWAAIEPRLSVAELELIAEPKVRSGPRRNADLAELVFATVAPALRSDHPAWQAFRAPRPRLAANLPADLLVFAPAPHVAGAPARQLVEYARSALEAPQIEAERRADMLAVEVRAWLLAQGQVTLDPGTSRSGLLGIDVDGNQVYPAFQFRSIDPPVPYELVAALRDEIGWVDDPIGELGWWLTPNAWLGAPPARLLGTGREGEIEYAAAQLMNDSW